MQKNLKTYGGDPILALAAYNGGGGSVDFVKQRLGKSHITGQEWAAFMTDRRKKKGDNPNAWHTQTLNYVDHILHNTPNKLNKDQNHITDTLAKAVGKPAPGDIKKAQIAKQEASNSQKLAEQNDPVKQEIAKIKGSQNEVKLENEKIKLAKLQHKNQQDNLALQTKMFGQMAPAQPMPPQAQEGLPAEDLRAKLSKGMADYFNASQMPPTQSQVNTEDPRVAMYMEEIQRMREEQNQAQIAPANSLPAAQTSDGSLYELHQSLETGLS